jgi:uncharacterized membrane protein
VLFQAVCTPSRSFTKRGFRVLAGLLVAASGVTGAMFLALGAWPVVPFLGAEVAFALTLVAMHARGAARATELLLLVPGRFTILRTDARGRRAEIVLDPYWARVTYREDPGHAGALLVESRGRAVEIGRDLGAAEKATLETALAAALARARRPEFDNPQLRGE